MNTIKVELSNIEGASATLGWAGSHTVVVDPPEGTAGGRGLGFNGGELLALSIGGCFCNGLRYVAEEMEVALGKVVVGVTLELGGEPMVVVAAAMKIDCETLDGSDPGIVIEKTKATATVSNSLRQGFPITILTAS